MPQRFVAVAINDVGMMMASKEISDGGNIMPPLDVCLRAASERRKY